MVPTSLQVPSFAILASPHVRRKAFRAPVCFLYHLGAALHILCVGAARR